MNLITAVEKIVLRDVSEEEAKNFALTRYGELCAYIRSEIVIELLEKYKTKDKNYQKEEKSMARVTADM